MAYNKAMAWQLSKAKRLFIELISLNTPYARISFWAIITFLVFIAPYRWLGNLSVWQKLGWDSAPSIGLTRAYWLLIHGNPMAAWHRNSLIYLVILIGLPILAVDVYKIWHGQNKVSSSKLKVITKEE